MFSRPQTDDHPGVIAPPPVIFAVLLGIGIVLGWLLPGFLPPAYTTWMVVLGIVLGIGAFALGGGGVLVFLRNGTNVEPTKPALFLVKDGPYRLTRNPMYSALILMMLALGFIFSFDYALVMALPFAVILHHGVVLREEAYLTRKFGEDYTQYLSETRRWL